MKFYVFALFLPFALASAFTVGGIQSTFEIPCTPKDAVLTVPKRALSAYMFFSQEWREILKTENPDASFGELGKLLGAKWKELDAESKQPYLEQAAQDKVRAAEEKLAYERMKSAPVCDDE